MNEYNDDNIIYSNLTTKTSCPNGNSDCNYCETLWIAGIDHGTFTVSGAGDYVVTEDWYDPSQADTYSMNGTYVWDSSGNSWNKQGFGPTNNNHFIMYYDENNKLTIFGNGPAGVPSWQFNGVDPEGSSCPPFTYSGWTKDTSTPLGIIINDPAPTVTKVESTSLRSSCANAGGVYYPGSIVSSYGAECRFYNLIPTEQDSSYCGSLPLNDNPGDYFNPYNGWSAISGLCCNNICQPPFYYNTNSCSAANGCPS
jgi:hypothetical protein